jgi:very-short-patch-repair endonuclease
VGRARVAAVLRLVDPESGSVLESLCRVLLHQAGLAPEQTQLVVRTAAGRWIGRVDFAWSAARLVVETDGFAFHADRTSFREDRRRGNALVLAGWRVLRFSWEDVVHHPEDVVAAVREALDGRALLHTA